MKGEFSNKKILYFVSEDSYFCSHRLQLALAAQKKGAEVVVVTRVSQHGDLIQKSGFRLIPLQRFNRSGLNFLNELQVILQLYSIYSRERPDIVHNIGLKPVLYGSFAALLTGIPRVINVLAGLGFIFTHNDFKTLFQRKLFLILFKNLSLKKGTRLIVQNKDDFKLIQKLKLIDPKRLFLIRGSGVDLHSFKKSPEPKVTSGVRIAFVTRMLKDKGVLELIEAIRILRDKKVKAQFLFCGDIDTLNPSSVSQKDLKTWDQEGLIEWCGHRKDIPTVYKNVHLAVLPSYREGLPKSLLEAASCGRAIVSTDVPGCREIVKHGINGLLVPPKNSPLLAEALEKLIKNPKLRQSMGKEGRRLVEEHFSIEKVISETLKCYI